MEIILLKFSLSNNDPRYPEITILKNKIFFEYFLYMHCTKEAKSMYIICNPPSLFSKDWTLGIGKVGNI